MIGARPLPRPLLSAGRISSSAIYAAASKRQSSSWTNAAQYLTLSNIRAYSPQIAAGAGVIVVIYGLSTAAYYVTSTLLHLDMQQVFRLGLFTGLAGGCMIAGGLVTGYRAMTISTQTVHKMALAKLAKSAQVRSLLGTGIASGQLRAYTLYPGHLSVGGKKLGWVEPRAEMLFQVVGDRGEGMATVQAVRHNGRVVLNLVALDTLATPGKPSQLVLVHGSEDKLHVRGTLRGFLQSERAQYIPQDRTVSDDDRLKEQEALPEKPSEEGDGEGEEAQQSAAAASSSEGAGSGAPKQ